MKGPRCFRFLHRFSILRRSWAHVGPGWPSSYRLSDRLFGIPWWGSTITKKAVLVRSCELVGTPFSWSKNMRRKKNWQDPMIIMRSHKFGLPEAAFFRTATSRSFVPSTGSISTAGAVVWSPQPMARTRSRPRKSWICCSPARRTQRKSWENWEPNRWRCMMHGKNIGLLSSNFKCQETADIAVDFNWNRR